MLAVKESGEGFPVVMVHGFTGSKEDWNYVAPALARQFRVISYDHRGHGESVKPAGRDSYSLDLLADDLAGLLPDRCHLVGHSMGAVVIQRYLARYGTDRVQRAVLVDTTHIGGRHREWNQRIRLVEEGGMARLVEHEEAEAGPNPLAEALPEVVAFLRDRALNMSPDAFCVLAEEMRDLADTRPSLSGVGIDVLVVCGENDTRTPPAINEALASALPRGRFALIAGAGHTPQFENVSGWLAVVAPFLCE